MGRRLSGNGGGGGALRAKTINAKVPLVTGLLTTVSSFGLLAPVTFARTGGNANLALASNGQISATAALAAGTTQSINGTATGADGVVLPFTANLTGQPTLGTLALSATTANTASSVTINIIGSVLGSTISGAVPPGMTLSSVNRTISGTPTAAGTHEFDLVETLSGAFGSPKTTRVSIVVTAIPTMDLGIGLRGIDTYSGYYPFANIMWNSSYWDRMSGTGTWSQNFGLLTTTDQNDVFRAYLSDAGVNLPTGTYTVINPDGLTIGFGANGDQRYKAFTNETQFTFNISNTSAGLYIFAKGNVTANTGALRVIIPGHLSSWQAGNYWNAEFLAFQTGAKPRVFRFMDWLSTMQDIGEENADWPSPSAVSFWCKATGGVGVPKVPYEICADLCNRIGADMWLNVPVRASDAAVDAIISRVSSVLNPSRRIYVELGNETWNYGAGYKDAQSWLNYFKHTRYEAAANGSGGWLKTAHGLTTGQTICGFKSKDSWGRGFTLDFGNQTNRWQLWTGSTLYVEATDADNFKVYEDSARTTLIASVAQYPTLIYKIPSEAGKTAGTNYWQGVRSVEIWSRFDTALGRGRITHVMPTQFAGASNTVQRLAAPGAFDATDVVAIAPYYAGEWWQGLIAVSSGQMTPSFWCSGASNSARVAIYAAGSTPTLAEVMAGTGTGFIAAQTINRTSGPTSSSYAAGTAFTGLTNGTAYAVRFVYTDTAGSRWMVGQNVTASATASTVVFNDSNANQYKRSLRNISTMLSPTLAGQVAAANGKPIVAYECGSDYFGPGYTGGTPQSLKDWRAAYTGSVEEGLVFDQFYRQMAAAGIKLGCQFNDVSADAGTFNMAESLTDTSDYRYQAFAAFNGKVPVTTRLDLPNITDATVATAPGGYPYNVVTLGPSTGIIYSLYNGDDVGNFDVSDNQLRLLNANGVNWSSPSNKNILVQATDGSTSDIFSVGITLGSVPVGGPITGVAAPTLTGSPALIASWDFAQSATITQVSGKIKSVSGADGTSYTLTAPTGNEPDMATMGGQPCARFSSSLSQYLNLNSGMGIGDTDPVTIIAIFALRSIGTSSGIVDIFQGTRQININHRALIGGSSTEGYSARKCDVNSVRSIALTGPSASDLNKHCMIGVMPNGSGTSTLLYMDGQGTPITGTPVSDNPTVTERLIIGATMDNNVINRFANMDLLRVLIYKTALTATQAEQIAAWSNANYLTANVV